MYVRMYVYGFWPKMYNYWRCYVSFAYNMLMILKRLNVWFFVRSVFFVFVVVVVVANELNKLNDLENEMLKQH